MTEHLRAILSLDKSRFDSGIKSTGESLNKFKSLAGRAFTIGAVIKLVNDVRALADEISTMAKALGVSTDFLQRFQGAARDAGVDTEKATQAVEKLTVRIAEVNDGNKNATELFNRLGLSVRDSNENLKSTESIMFELSDSLRGVESDVERVKIAYQLFGRGGAEALAMLTDGSDKLKESMEGQMIMTEGAINAFDKFDKFIKRVWHTTKILTGELLHLQIRFDEFKMSIFNGIKVLVDQLSKLDFSKMFTSPIQFAKDLANVLSNVKTELQEIAAAEAENAKLAKEQEEEKRQNAERELARSKAQEERDKAAEDLRQKKLSDQEKYDELKEKEIELQKQIEGLEEGSIARLKKEAELLELQKDIVDAKAKAESEAAKADKDSKPTSPTVRRPKTDMDKLSDDELKAQEKELAQELKEAPLGRNDQGRPLSVTEAQRQKTAESITGDRERVAGNIESIREWQAENVRRMNMGLPGLTPPELLKPGETKTPTEQAAKTTVEKLDEIREMMEGRGIVVRPVLTSRKG